MGIKRDRRSLWVGISHWWSHASGSSVVLSAVVSRPHFGSNERICPRYGPFRTDYWQYVFGNERPKPNLNKGAGLDVSPAVRDYLGLSETDVTDWRFVEFSEVSRGPWSTLGENNTFVISDRKTGRQLAEASNRADAQ
jgi:hypothetical protein